MEMKIVVLTFAREKECDDMLENKRETKEKQSKCEYRIKVM